MSLAEETNELMLDFDKIERISNSQHVIPVAVQNAITNEIILIAYTNKIAFEEAIRLRKAVFWSTSRNEIWYKGYDSGNTYILKQIFVNCEQNSLVYKVIPDKGGICHTNYKGKANNCFYRELDMESMNLKNVNHNLDNN